MKDARFGECVEPSKEPTGCTLVNTERESERESGHAKLICTEDDHDEAKRKTRPESQLN